jgi:hypothetical protein
MAVKIEILPKTGKRTNIVKCDRNTGHKIKSYKVYICEYKFICKNVRIA